MGRGDMSCVWLRRKPVCLSSFLAPFKIFNKYQAWEWRSSAHLLARQQLQYYVNISGKRWKLSRLYPFVEFIMYILGNALWIIDFTIELPCHLCNYTNKRKEMFLVVCNGIKTKTDCASIDFLLLNCVPGCIHAYNIFKKRTCITILWKYIKNYVSRRLLT